MIRSRRVFSQTKGQVSKTIRVSEDMYAVIEELARKQGETSAGYIVLALDWYFQGLAEAGEIPWPEEPKTAVKKKKR